MNLNRIDDAIELGKSLSDLEQIQYFSRLTSSWQSYDPDSLLKNLSRLPENGVRSTVAHDILRNQEFTGLYTADEVEFVSTFIKKD